ncbi:putative 5-formyltetrahydrofolate cyclo-ligase [bacterium BMS3Abin07]|nr:putative 5-formyltetrahydrofolate cyclo-ligase [bacterium BMS3Abin07]GBE33472.1 putative 5-formyltetrahydrofolate cyclo-ligase [bacterium BMS3Bbin05]HDL20207.1 5-formyltetrahydrofolate cyclo-ligase [Nitrospirota bacterium]HDO23236.1 5-formyltetrahydrofolate cyclo-ligase [Nitrospirota bacterium]HDZ88014.1 5-formyltetrahydrofolate cyclo-ligase [Nitrospirota bacterium]
MTNNKWQIRAGVIRKRDSIPSNIRRAKDRMIAERLTGMKEYIDADSVMLFASFRSEVNTLPIIEDALRGNKKVVLPKVDRERKELELYLIKSVNELTPGYMGIPEPAVTGERKFLPGEIDFIMVPGLAFDENGGRLGYGGGYYDRLLGGLKKMPQTVAIAYEEQIVDDVPVSGHDIRVDAVVTDRRIIKTAGDE